MLTLKATNAHSAAACLENPLPRHHLGRSECIVWLLTRQCHVAVPFSGETKMSRGSSDRYGKRYSEDVYLSPVTGHTSGSTAMCLQGWCSSKTLNGRRRLLTKSILFRSEQGWCHGLMDKKHLPHKPEDLSLIPGTQEGGRREPVPQMCPLTTTCTLWDTHVHVSVHTQDDNK